MSQQDERLSLLGAMRALAAGCRMEELSDQETTLRDRSAAQSLCISGASPLQHLGLRPTCLTVGSRSGRVTASSPVGLRVGRIWRFLRSQGGDPLPFLGCTLTKF